MNPEKLGPFKIGRVLGRGGMGAVYEGTHETDGSIVAIKVLTDTLDEDTEGRVRFESEIETLKLLHHPNIVRLSGFGEEQGRLYYVMEFIDGISLQQELRKKRFFEWYEVAKIGLEICQALRHAHDRGVIHRDIKPANILLDRQGNIKLSDFGIARFFGGRQITDAHSVVGTLEYMSPEQALANPIGLSSDLYSLGCVLYALLTDKPPFAARSLPELLRKHADVSPVPVQSIRYDVPDDLEYLIADLLLIRPEGRPRNAQLVAKRLQSLLHALVEDPAEIKVFPMTPETPRRQQPPASPSFDDLLGAFSLSNVDGSGTVEKPAATVPVEQPKDSAKIDLLADTVTLSSVIPHGEVLPKKEQALPPVKNDSLSDAAVHKADSPPELPKPSTRFTAVTERSFEPFEEERGHPIVSLPTVLTSITLMIVGLVVYYLTQPVPPEVLLKRITAAIPQGESADEGMSIASMKSAQKDILHFLGSYPDHPSAEQVQSYQDDLNLLEHERRLERRATSRSLSPVERAYVEVLTSSPNDPELTIDRLHAFIAVFQAAPAISENGTLPHQLSSSPVEICVELARRRLKKLEQGIDEINADQAQVLRQRLDKAAEWDSQSPEHAEGIRRGIIELYQNHRWAKELVEEAQQRLKE